MNVYCIHCGQRISYSDYWAQWHHSDTGDVFCAFSNNCKAEPDNKHWNR